MAQSEVAICNRALGAIGSDALISLAQETKAARLCALLYPELRDEVLRSHPWNGATARAALPALTAAPAFEFAYAYQLPSDCLRVLRVYEAHASDRWLVEGRTIVTDLSAPLRIEYIRQVTDPALLDPLLTSAIAARLAMDLATSLADNASLRQQMEREYKRVLREARGVDGQESSLRRLASDAFVEARL